MDERLRTLVRERAGNRCEYCRVHQDDDPLFTFPVDHIIALQHGGPTAAENLCQSCYRCNSRKGPNIAGRDKVTGNLVPLFHPRFDDWDHHFEWHGPLLVGKTEIGRTTVEVLAINNAESVILRESLIDEGRFPPVG